MKTIVNVLKKGAAVVGGLVASASASAASLIPTGSLTTVLADITDTGADAFALVLPVMVGILGLGIAYKLIKRFIGGV